MASQAEYWPSSEPGLRSARTRCGRRREGAREPTKLESAAWFSFLLASGSPFGRSTRDGGSAIRRHHPRPWVEGLHGLMVLRGFAPQSPPSLGFGCKAQSGGVGSKALAGAIFDADGVSSASGSLRVAPRAPAARGACEISSGGGVPHVPGQSEAGSLSSTPVVSVSTSGAGWADPWLARPHGPRPHGLLSRGNPDPCNPGGTWPPPSHYDPVTQRDVSSWRRTAAFVPTASRVFRSVLIAVIDVPM